MPLSRAPHVLIFSGTPGRGSGAERVLEYLLQAPDIREQVAGVISPSNSPVFEIAEELGLPVHEWHVANDSLAAALRAVPTLLRSYRPPGNVRTLHAWHTRGFEIAGLLGRRWNLATSGTLHDHPQARHSLLRQKVIRFSANRLDRLAAVSRALEKTCRAAQWSVPIATLPNGLPNTSFVPRETEAADLKIGFVGLNGKWKGIELLKKVVADTSDLPLRWHLYGDPMPDTAPILSQLLAGSNGHVEHFGYRSSAQIFSEIDLLFHPSMEFDPYPTALLEAARAGVPALASDVGGSGEIVRSDETGKLFPAGDRAAAAAALQELTKHRDRIRVMGLAARSLFEKDFTLEGMAERYIQFWR